MKEKKIQFANQSATTPKFAPIAKFKEPGRLAY
jgi:hypothetical protein